MNVINKDWSRSKVIEKILWDDAHFSLRIALPAAFSYQAGQFSKIGLGEGENFIFRPFSIVSAPQDPFLDFYAIKNPSGALSPRLYALSQGDSLFISHRVLGHLTVSKLLPGKTLWLLGTGTGIAPYLSLLREGKVFDQFTQVILVQGIRYAHQKHHQKVLDQLQHRYLERFQYHCAVSKSDLTYPLAGRLSALLATGQLELFCKTGFNPATDQVMLCGHPEMVKDLTHYLVKKRGFIRSLRPVPGNVLIERYW